MLCCCAVATTICTQCYHTAVLHDRSTSVVSVCPVHVGQVPTNEIRVSSFSLSPRTRFAAASARRCAIIMLRHGFRGAESTLKRERSGPPVGANRYPDLCELRCLESYDSRLGTEMPARSERERVEKVISASHISVRDSVVARLALGQTYCKLARLADSPVKRHHLFTLACEALTMAEEYVAVAPPELLLGVLEYVQRLRLEIRQLSLWKIVKRFSLIAILAFLFVHT